MQILNKADARVQKLIISAAYVAVILIWSTTPVAIKWSGEEVGYIFGIVLRMLIGTVLALFLVMIKFKKMPITKSAFKAYFAVAITIFGGMMPVYWGAQYISSGLISVLFGVTPIVTGYLAWRILHEQSFSALKIGGALTGLLGLVVIFLNRGATGDEYIYGVIAILIAVLLHSASAVWIKSIKPDIPALVLVAGGLIFSMPFFVIVYLLLAPPLPEIIPSRALWSIVYLGVVGSVLGFVSYYYLLKQMTASSVALITLITPVCALWIGHVLNNETISASIYAGTAFVLSGLALHQGGDLLYKSICRKRKNYYG